jgi:cation diffusion facilitator CzcD-associated flavoprotein CzcO
MVGRMTPDYSSGMRARVASLLMHATSHNQPGAPKLTGHSDVPALFYSFSFAQNPNWTSFHPPGPEIVQYYHEVCEKYKITDKIELNTDIEQCRWLEDEQLWEVTIRRMAAGMGDLSAKDRMKVVQEKGEAAVYSETEIVKAKVVVSCVGGLVEPRGWPDEIRGIENFKGKVFHSARWDQTVDFTDKNVVVVGTGCSSAQLVPRLPNAPYNAKSVTQLMRSPPWVVPSVSTPGGDAWWEINGPKLLRNVPGLKEFLRFMIFAGAEQQFVNLFPNTPRAEKHRKIYEDKVLKHMRKTVPEKYHAIMTPDYGVGCKRRIFDKRWLKSLNNEKIELTTQPMNRVTESGVVIGPGATYPANATEQDYPEREIPADVIVLANGFDTTRWLHPLKVVGKGGQDLVQLMEERGGAQAYQGTAMDGFPNMFLIFGPNTATGHSSVVMASENMVNYSLNFIKLILNGDAKTVDVKKEAEMAYTAEMQEALKDTVWRSGCASWYFTKDGWNSTVYPYVHECRRNIDSPRANNGVDSHKSTFGGDALSPNGTTGTLSTQRRASGTYGGQGQHVHSPFCLPLLVRIACARVDWVSRMSRARCEALCKAL